MKRADSRANPRVALALACALLPLTLAARVPGQDARPAPVASQKGVKVGRAGDIAELPSGGKRWALVIGVDDYKDSQIGSLRGAANDARVLADALKRYAGFPADQIVLMTTEQPEERQPTRVNILRRLSNLASVVPKDGLLLVSFSGHGIERGGHAYLLPSDAQITEDLTFLEETAVSVSRMRERIKATGVGQVLILLDACRNDPGGRADAPNTLTEAYTRGFSFDVRNREVQAFATLYATAVGQRAYEYSEKRQGYFTWALVEGLKGEAANERGEVTLAGLVRYVQEMVPKRIAVDLGGGKDQRPFAIIEGYKAEELAIAVSPVQMPPPAPPVALRPVDPVVIELSFWETIRNSTNPADFKAYLEKYPDGQFTILARLRARTEPTPTPTPNTTESAGTAPSSKLPETAALSARHPSPTPTPPVKSEGAKRQAAGTEVAANHVSTPPEQKQAARVPSEQPSPSPSDKEARAVSTLTANAGNPPPTGEAKSLPINKEAGGVPDRERLDQLLSGKEYVQAFILGDRLLKETPDDLGVLINTSFAGLVLVTSGNNTYLTPSAAYTKKAIDLIEAGKVPAKAATFGKDRTLGWFNYALGIYKLEQSPADAIALFKKAAKSEEGPGKDPQTFALLATAYRNGRFERLKDKVQSLSLMRAGSVVYGGSVSANSELAQAESELQSCADKIIDAYARAVTLSGDSPKYQQSKATWMQELLNFYRYRHGSEKGLDRLLKNVLSKSLP